MNRRSRQPSKSTRKRKLLLRLLLLRYGVALNLDDLRRKDESLAEGVGRREERDGALLAGRGDGGERGDYGGELRVVGVGWELDADEEGGRRVGSEELDEGGQLALDVGWGWVAAYRERRTSA